MRLEPYSERGSVLLGALNPQRERPDASEGEERLHGPGDGAVETAVLAEPGGELGAPGDGDAEDDVGVPSEELRRGVDGDVSAEVKRALPERGGKVLSTARRTPRSRVPAARARMSAMSMSGFVGDSTQNNAAPSQAARVA